MDSQTVMLRLWEEVQKEQDKQVAYAFSDRDKKHIIAQTYGKILAELWKLDLPKFSEKTMKRILKKYPELRECPPNLAYLLYYSEFAANFLWNAIQVEYPKRDDMSVLEANPLYQKTKKEFEEKYGKNTEN